MSSEWTRHHPDAMVAATWGRYEIIRYYFGQPAGWQYVVHRDGNALPGTRAIPDSYRTLAEAKSAAEADADGLAVASCRGGAR